MSDKNSILERISTRDAHRIEKLQKAHKAREQVDASDENEDYFATVFNMKSLNIEDMLAQVPTLEINTLQNHFDNMKKEITELQKYVVTSSLFLKGFNMRKYLGIVQNLQTNCYDIEEKFVPRKKFGFTKKKLLKNDNEKHTSIDDHDSTGVDARNKWSENLFGFDSKKGEILNLDPEKLFERDVTLRDLKNCTVALKGVLGTLHMSNLDNCIILCGPVSTSVFVEKCTNCKIIVACQQLRMHSSVRCDIYLHVTSKGIVEDCSEIRTAPYNLDYEDLERHYNISTLDRSINNWDKLDDFNWLAPNIASPNWKVLEPELRYNDWRTCWNKLPSELTLA